MGKKGRGGKGKGGDSGVIVPTCAACTATVDLMLCNGCRRVSYCSRACQREHWRHGGHKARCTELRQQAAAVARADVGAAVAMSAGAAAAASALPTHVSRSLCWVCMDDDSALGVPKLQGCACQSRRSHLHCLFKTASALMEQRMFEDRDEACRAWTHCDVCTKGFSAEVQRALLEKEMLQDPEMRQGWCQKMAITLMRYQAEFMVYSLEDSTGVTSESYEDVLREMLDTRLIPEMEALTGLNSPPVLELKILRIRILVVFGNVLDDPSADEDAWIAEIRDLLTIARAVFHDRDYRVGTLRRMLWTVLDECERTEECDRIWNVALWPGASIPRPSNSKVAILDDMFQRGLDETILWSLWPKDRVVEFGRDLLEEMRLQFGPDHNQVRHFTGVLAWVFFHVNEVEEAAQLILAKLDSDFRAMEFEQLVDPYAIVVQCGEFGVDRSGKYIGLDCLLHKLHERGLVATAKAVYEHAVETAVTSLPVVANPDDKFTFKVWTAARKFQARRALDLGDVAAAEPVCRTVLSDFIVNSHHLHADHLADVRGSLASVLIYNPQKTEEAQELYSELMLDATWQSRNVEVNDFHWNTQAKYFFPHHMFAQTPSVDAYT